MRTLSVVLIAPLISLFPAACSSGGGEAEEVDGPAGDDDDDFIEEGIVDRCDDPDPDLPVTLRFGEMVPIDVEGMSSVYHVPDDPRAVLFLFHGSEGNASEMNYLEQWRLINRMHCHGIAVLAGSSLNDVWSTAAPAGDNPDIQRIDALWDAVDAEEGLPRDLPVLAGGFSNGGGYSAVFANLMADEGWDMRALTFHNTNVTSSVDYPAVWSSSENDEVAPPSSMRSRADDLEAKGLDSLYFEWKEAPLTSERLQVIDGIIAEEADLVFDELVKIGVIDGEGSRLFELDRTESIINRIQSQSEFGGIERITRQLRVVWATHRFSGDEAYAEADFLVSFL